MSESGTAVFVLAVFALAGAVKGVAGLGLPTVAMAALALAMPPVEAAATMVVPSLVTNAWQAYSGPALLSLLKRLAPLFIGIVVATPLGIGFLATASMASAVALGVVLVIYALVGLFAPPLVVPLRAQGVLAPVIGAATGVLTGATGVFAVPAVPYLSAIGLAKDELVQALGLAFSVATLALAAALACATDELARVGSLSLVAVVPAFAGMIAGQRLRDRLDERAFRRVFFWAMLGVGCYQVARAVGRL
ncbi:MAG: sulfite exporter TauE/SafE family protein [Burkholderiales bacterium]|nr:sulfite exporter TauE/SafE family protein [Burkholderiales bacterium]MCC7114740.1 sulfite exporter TauE/SafE family protein [Burkholderiales bacterium]